MLPLKKIYVLVCLISLFLRVSLWLCCTSLCKQHKELYTVTWQQGMTFRHGMEVRPSCAETKFVEKCDRLKTILEHVNGLGKMASCPREEYVSLGNPLLLINRTTYTLGRLRRASWARWGVKFFLSWGGDNSSYGVQLCNVSTKGVEPSRNCVPYWAVRTDNRKSLDDFY